MKLHAFLLASLAATPAVVAQSPSVTVPSHNAFLSGNDSALTPFGYDAFRCQQVYAGSSIATSAAWIQSIAFRQDYGLTRYRASALMTFGFNKREIRQLVGRASPDIGRAA